MTEHCPICAEFRYSSLVSVCPICGAEGKKQEIASVAEDFVRQLELDTVAEFMEHSAWPWPEACPNSEGWLENGIPQEVWEKHRERYPIGSTG